MLEPLIEVIDPPLVQPGPIDWDGVHDRLGLVLPDDYRAFADTYGETLIGSWLMVLAPDASGASTYIARLAHTQNDVRLHRAAAPDDHPYALHPEVDGLLAWGSTARTDVFLWDTASSTDPNRWLTRILCRDRHGHHVWRTAELPTVEIIAAMVRGELPLHPNEERRPIRRHVQQADRSSVILSETAPTHLGARPLAQRASVPLAPTIAIRAGGQRTWPWPESAAPPGHRELVEVLGPGTLAGELRLLVPGGPDGFDVNVEQERLATRFAERRSARQPTVSALIAPQPAGLRLWGVFADGETAWWVPVDRDPSQWPVLLVDSDGAGWQRIDMTTTEFLDCWLNGWIDPPVLSRPPAQRDREYVPAGAGQVWSASRPPSGIHRDRFAQLATLIGPGKQHRTFDWQEIEREVGVTALPSDYKQLCERYGRVNISGLHVVPPDTLAESHTDASGYLRDFWANAVAESMPEPLPFVPDPGGLLLFAHHESRDRIWWDASDPDPDKWTMVWDVAFDRRRFGGTCTELIIAGQLGLIGRNRHPYDDGPDVFIAPE